MRAVTIKLSTLNEALAWELVLEGMGQELDTLESQWSTPSLGKRGHGWYPDNFQWAYHGEQRTLGLMGSGHSDQQPVICQKASGTFYERLYIAVPTLLWRLLMQSLYVLICTLVCTPFIYLIKIFSFGTSVAPVSSHGCTMQPHHHRASKTSSPCALKIPWGLVADVSLASPLLARSETTGSQRCAT